MHNCVHCAYNVIVWGKGLGWRKKREIIRLSDWIILANTRTTKSQAQVSQESELFVHSPARLEPGHHVHGKLSRIFDFNQFKTFKRNLSSLEKKRFNYTKIRATQSKTGWITISSSHAGASWIHLSGLFLRSFTYWWVKDCIATTNHLINGK